MSLFESRASNIIGSGDSPSVFRVLDPDLLLSTGVGKEIIDQVKQLVNVPEGVWGLVYMPMFRNFISLCQHIPLNGKPNERRALDSCMMRMRATMVYYVPLIRNKLTRHDEERFIFTLCSASLLHGVGRLFQNHVMEQVTKSGHYQNTVFPNVALLQSGYYRLRSVKASDEAFIEAMHVSYASVVLPKEGLAWIMEDQQLYLVWAKALANFSDGFDTLDIDVDLKEESTIDEIIGKDVQTLNPIEMQEAEKFWAWLKALVERHKGQERYMQDMGLLQTKSGIEIDIDRLTAMYADESGLSEFDRKQLKSVIAYLGVGVVAGGVLTVESESRFFETGAFGPVTSAQSQSVVASSERFCARIGGVAMQFMQSLGHGRRQS